MRMRLFSLSFALSGLLFLGAAVLATPMDPTQAEQKNGAAEIEFTDVREQTLEFMRYYETIQLTREQETVKRAALSELRAACCAGNSAYTCCCVCNLSRTVWGLTAYLITEKDAGVEEVQTAVRDWIQFVNPAGFSGDACFNGGCMRSFAKNGCGGMQPDRLIWE